MYIWVILATFMVALYSFNLAYRADIRSVEVEPIARALISKMIIKQQAAGRYMRGNTPPFASTTDSQGNKISSDTVTYSAGILTSQQLRPSEGVTFLPYGYKDDGTVTTEIYCVDKENHDSAKDCASQDARRYLITYGPIDARWINRKSGRPGNDLLSAMNNVMGNTITFGYTVIPEDVHPDTGDIQGIVSRENVQIYIPNYIYRNGEYAKACGNKDTAAEYCLVYITPY